MKIPKNLKIGGCTYTIKIVPRAQMDVSNFAEIEQGAGEILIAQELKQDQKEASLFHEILHAINLKIGEKDVEFISQALYQVLRDNRLLKE